MTIAAQDDTVKAASRILVVDLDGTLIRTDLLIETAFAYLGRYPWRLFFVLGWALRGKAFLKHRLAEAVDIDASTLPYNRAVTEHITAAQRNGARVYLASASNARLVRAVAEHMAFDGWFASDQAVNLSAETKAARLVETFGSKGFDYIGDTRADLAVWKQASVALFVGRPRGLLARLRSSHDNVETLENLDPPASLRTWIRLLRPHQWIKNILVAVPLVTAHAFSFDAIWRTGLAFVAFSLCASSVYVINDLVDVQADRGHPTKKNRPFAAGSVPILGAATLAPLLLAVSAVVALTVSWQFLAVLAAYWVSTCGYTFILKRKMMIDVVTLGGLYTLRVIGGAVAINVSVSEWLLGFSMFIFLCLALVKRHSEMAERLDAGLPDPSNRNYRVTDLATLIALASSAGYSAVIVFSLYLTSPAVKVLYHHPKALWLVIPLLVYWISRVITLSHRRLVHDDPIVFALKDRVSLVTAGLIALVGIVAV